MSAGSDKTCALLHELVMTGVDDKLAVIYDTGVTSRSMSYDSLQKIANLIKNRLTPEVGNDESSGRGGFVGIKVDQYEVFPAILLGILQAGMGFYCMDHEAEYSEDLQTLRLLNIRYVIVDQDFHFPEKSVFADLECNSTIKLYLLTVELGTCTSHSLQYDSLESTTPAYEHEEWAYAIRTSGTTSNRKLVLVSHQSIVPNVLDFAEKFQLSSTDVIFGVSPATFDPHVVDVFITLKCGGTIIYTPKSIKLRPLEFTNLFSKHGITVLQCTPSLFYRLDEDEARCLFHNNHQLRIIAFGGEPCPQKEYLRKIIPPACRGNVSIWNLYGTTELSCWAAANPVKINTADQIGILQNPISDTFYKIVRNNNNEAEILLGTKQRRCTVLKCEDGKIEFPVEEDGISFRRTGDTVDVEELPFVVYKGRTDNTFKRQGHFVDLYDLEHRLASIAFVENVVCFGDFGRIYVVIVFLNNSSLEQFEVHRRQLLSEIHKRVPIRSLPDHVTVLHPKDVPLTPNGKLDMKWLKQQVLEKKLTRLENCYIPYDAGDVKFMLSCAWELFAGSRCKPSPESQFLEFGGDSLKVMQLVEYIFQELNLFGTFLQQLHSPEMIRVLISSTFSSLVDFVRNVILPKSEHKVTISAFTDDSVLVNSKLDSRPKAKDLQSQFKVILNQNIPEPKLELQPYPNYNTYGCVDSTPVLISHPALGRIVVGASNSGYAIAVAVVTSKSNCEAPSTNLVWYQKFPDRLVASVAVTLDQLTLFIGCCDCRLYAVDAKNGHIVWNFFSGGLLLTPPVVVRQELVIISADSGWVFGLTQKTGQLTWKLHFDGLISSLSPHLSSSCLFLATDKEIVRVNSDIGVICHGYPLQTIYTNFASHLEQTLCVGSSSVDNGTKFIHVLSFGLDKMEKLWTIDTTGSINNPVFHSTPDTSTIGVFYVTKTGRICVHDIGNGRMYSHLELGTPVASTPTFLPSKGNQNRIAIISKNSDLENVMQIFFIKLVNEVTRKIGITLESKDVAQLTFANTSIVLTNILYDGNHLIFGRRDDRVYFINSSIWETYIINK